MQNNLSLAFFVQRNRTQAVNESNNDGTCRVNIRFLAPLPCEKSIIS